MKKLLALFLALVELFVFAACGGSGDNTIEEPPPADGYAVVTGERLRGVEDIFDGWLVDAAWQTHKITITGDYGAGTLYCCDTEGQEALSFTMNSNEIKRETYVKDGVTYQITNEQGKPPIRSEFFDRKKNLGIVENFMLANIKDFLSSIFDWDGLIVSSTEASVKRYIRLEFATGGDTYDIRAKINASNKITSMSLDFFESGTAVEMFMEPYSGTIPFPSGLKSEDNYMLVTDMMREGVINEYEQWLVSDEWQKFSGAKLTTGQDYTYFDTFYSCSIEGQESAVQKTVLQYATGDEEMELYIKDGITYVNDRGYKSSVPYGPAGWHLILLEWRLADAMGGPDYINFAEIYITAPRGARKVKFYIWFDYSMREVIFSVDENNFLTSIEAKYVYTYPGYGFNSTTVIEPYDGEILLPDGLNETNYPPQGIL